MKLSIMFITQNRKLELVRAIDSCLKHGIEDMEIIIVDNNSDDGTQEYVEEFLETNKVKYIYHYSDENLGVAGGRNKAFSMATGEYVFSLDDDAVVETENFFEEICNRMDAEPEAVAAAVQIYEPESKKLLKGKTYKSRNQRYQGVIAFSFLGGAHILRRDFYMQRKLYPEKLVFGSEEFYPSLVAHKENKIIPYFGDLKVLHIPSKIARVEGKKRDLNIILNNHIVRKLCYPLLMIPLLEILFKVRIIRHGLYKYKSYKEIMALYNSRYNPVEANRMDILCFWKLVRDVGFLYLV